MGNQLSKISLAQDPKTPRILREQTRIFARVWLAICNHDHIPQTAVPLDPAIYRNHWLFKKEMDVEFFEVEYASSPKAYSPRTDRALNTLNSCTDSIYVCFDRVCQRLLALPHVKTVEWINIDPRPRLVLVEKEIDDPFMDPVSLHECILITAVDDSEYVLDLSGWQFGFDDYFYTLEEYQSKCMAPGTSVKVRDHVAEFVIFARCYADHSERLLELQAWKREITGASDRVLKKLAKKVNLPL